MELATYSEEDLFNHSAAKGFITLWGLPLKMEKKYKKT